MLPDRRASLGPDQLGKMRGMVIEYGASLVAKQIEDDCFDAS
jgi:hypothetical protein